MLPCAPCQPGGNSPNPGQGMPAPVGPESREPPSEFLAAAGAPAAAATRFLMSPLLTELSKKDRLSFPCLKCLLESVSRPTRSE